MTKFRHSEGQKQRRKPYFEKGKTPFVLYMSVLWNEKSGSLKSFRIRE